MRQAIGRRLTAGIGAALLLAAALTVTGGPAQAADTLISQGRTATASSVETSAYPASAAVDGDLTNTRWSSAFADPQWLQIDLGAAATIGSVKLTWEAAYATAFQIQTSNDASAWTTIYGTTSGTGGTQTLTVSGSGRYVRMYGTARATPYGYSLYEFQVYGTYTSTPPTGGGTATTMPDSFWGDTSTIPAAKNVVEVKVLNKTNGHYPDSQVFWSFNGQTHSIAEQPYIDMAANSSGRMYFYLGSANSQYFDFIEFTVGNGVFNGNTTRVDAFGLKLALRLHSHDGDDQQVGEDYTTFTEDRTATFTKFQNEVPTEFKHLATATAPYRINAPANDSAFLSGGQYQTYMSSYAQANGINATTWDVFACANALAQAADKCGALNRHVYNLPQDQWGNTANFYQAAPADYYAKFWHDHSLGNKAYGFPYDDAAGQSTFISHQNPQYLLVAVGW